MKSKRVLHFLTPQKFAVAAAAFSVLTSICLAQSDEAQPPPSLVDVRNPSAVMTFSDGTRVALRSRSGCFPLVAAAPGDVIGVEVRVSGSNGTAFAESLDGGALSSGADKIALNPSGAGSFAFQVGRKPGLYRVFVTGGSSNSTVQFWVPDPNNPNSTPPLSQGL